MKQFFTYVKNDFISRLKSKKLKFKGVSYAFTLAEVLITLGVIGVVAAMTLPTLIQNYKNQVYVNKLKKMISTLENGIRKAAADEGVEVKESKFFMLFNVYSCHQAGVCPERVEAISKYFKVLEHDKIAHRKTYTGDGYSCNNTLNGNIIFMDGSAINYQDNCGASTIKVDINGNDKPNIYGRDYFLVRVDNAGLIHDIDDCNTNFVKYTSDDFIGGWTWANEVTSCGLCKDKLENNPNYDGCYLYRLQSNGWKMDY